MGVTPMIDIYLCYLLKRNRGFFIFPGPAATRHFLTNYGLEANNIACVG